jgi:serine/threonine-protein kinase RsbW/stage II sporulation protein AB (anti-sigma F factor)
VVHWEAKFPAIAISVAAVRGEIAAIARRCGLDAERVAGVKLAVSEAATNVVMHAYRNRRPPPEGSIAATVVAEHGELVVVIADDGLGMAPRPDSPGLGLGLPIIASIAERVQVVSRAQGTAIYMVFPCPASAAAPAS